MRKERLAAIALGIIGCGVFGSAMATPVQWKAAEGGNDHVYDIVVNDSHQCSEVVNGIRFNEAMSEANAMGGHLATPNLTGEASFIYDNLVAPTEDGKDQRYWLGAYCNDGGQEYRWVTGEPVTGWGGYTRIEGAGGDIPHAIFQGGDGGAALQDLPATGIANGYVVEFAPPAKGNAKGDSAEADDEAAASLVAEKAPEPPGLERGSLGE